MKKPRGGFTLVEVMMGILLTAIIVTSVFGVCLTAKTSSKRYDQKLIAKNAANMVASQLQNYMASSFDAGLGPNQACSSNTWSLALPGQPCGDGSSALDATVTNCTAESQYSGLSGCHDATAFVPAKYQAAPYNMTLVYIVTRTVPASCPDSSGNACANYQINIKTDWTELQ